MVAIKDMEMPRRCECCIAFEESDYGDWCKLTTEDVKNKEAKLNSCPLVEIEERKVGKCMDCEEYNQEKHYCPKFCDVIRDTTKEMQEFYKGEHEKLEKIERIYKQWAEIGDNADSWTFRQIGEVLNG